MMDERQAAPARGRAGADIGEHRWLRVALRALIRAFLFVFLPVRALGTEHLPPSGGVILCANHESLVDPIALICSLTRWIRFMAKKEIMNVWGFGAFLRALGVFPVDRGAGDLQAVRTSLGVLKGGEVLGIFPQGRRAFKGSGAFLSGVALIALKSGAPVVPAYIAGRARLFHRLHLTFGPAVDLSEYAGRFDSRTLEAATERIRQAVYALKEASD